MIITTIETIPGMKIKAHCGLVSGSTVRSKNAFKDFVIRCLTEIQKHTENVTCEQLIEEINERLVYEIILQD